VVVMVVVVRLSGGMRKARGVGLCQNSQNRAGVLGFGHAV
jgi:hypothetical protein